MLKPIEESLVFTELDHEVFDALVPADHYLRRVKRAIDFAAFRPAITAAYNPDKGRPSIEPTLLLKLEFLQFHYGLSDREVIARSQVDVAFRFFLDLGLRGPLPDPSLLTYFRARLGPEAHQRVFQNLIGQARSLGLVKDRLRLKDATHVLADIAVPSTLALVAQVRDHLLEAAAPFDPERVAAERHELERLRTATADLTDAQRLAHRVEHLRAVVAWTDERLRLGGPPAPAMEPLWRRLAAASELAHKILRDRDDPEAPDRTISAEDPEARTGWHHGWFDGYLLDIAMDADSEFITAIDVLPANADEAADAGKLIEQEERAHGNDIEALSIDGAGFRGDLLEQWTDPAKLGLEVIVPPREPAATGGFPPEAFALDAAGEELTCPAGKTTRTRERNTNDTGWKYRFAARDCDGCPLRRSCLTDPEKVRRRSVIKNDHEAAYRAAREKAQTARYQEVRRQHPRIERKLGELVRWHAARRARYRGKAKVLIQGLLTGWVVNIKRLVKLVESAGAAAAGTVRAGCAGV